MNISESSNRRWRRYAVEARLKVSVRRNGNKTSVFGRSSSLSEGGMGAYIPCEIPLGESVVLEVTLPGSANEIMVTATVRNVAGFRYGLEFHRLSDDARVRIVKCCDAAAVPS